ncbi:MAG: potassium transporter Kup, partial [Bdellovibrionales bacterium]|nr:potassium transporter Kup [Bdellovibrionales bacterium]
HHSHGLELAQQNVLGILSLVFWSLTLVVTIKYLMFILRADNHGEGGIMALLALVTPKLQEGSQKRLKLAVISIGLFGAALLYGDGIITPAISVLSAVEGLQVATPALQPYVVPITVVILIGLFLFQSKGTAALGAIFGRIMLVYFLTIAAIGIPWIIRKPDVLQAIYPSYAMQFFIQNGWHGFFVLGAVVLCITGGEALYADMGHFGKRPIRLGWFGIVMPALLLNYFGQGAFILEKGLDGVQNPFFGLVSEMGWAIYPLVALATVATVIASQALISGAFSLTQQAVQLGYLPRTFIRHTSRETEGQIFIPRVNFLLMIACVALVLTFKESSNLAAAYGIAVTGTMVITSVLFFFVAIKLWNWSKIQAGVLVSFFLALDLAFFGANIVKLKDGGWVPALIAASIFALMSTWKRGREALASILSEQAIPLQDFIDDVVQKKVARVKGTAVFMTLSRNVAPSVLLHHLKHNRSLHERVILLSVMTEHTPDVSANQKVRVTELSHGFFKVTARYGYMESPDVSEILIFAMGAGLPIEIEKLSFYLGRESILPNGKTPMSSWRKKLFILFSRNSRPATEYFRIPPDQVIEIGAQISI